MAHTTPRVEQDILVEPTNRPVSVGSPQWYAWLDNEENRSFFFSNEAGSFTARKERRKRGGWYWIAYRSRRGRLVKTYMGRSEDLTLERLRETTVRLAEQQISERHKALSTQLAQPDVTSRFTPPPLAARPFKLIERPELLKQLDESLRQHKLTLVTAPARFGKTTLLSMWYKMRSQQSHKQKIAWLALDERDNDPVRFWSALRSALLQNTQHTGNDSSAPLHSTPLMSIETVLAALLSRNSHRSILILDDYHTITNAQIHQQMQWLVTYLPADLHIIIVSRREPPLALGRARIYGELGELDADDLRLGRDEIKRFLSESVNLSLSAEEQAFLEQRTEGWIAGLQLITLALREQQQPHTVLAQFTGSQHSLFDYFAEEVFAQQSEAVQRFLLHTAPLTTFTPQLCAAMLDDEAHADNTTQTHNLLRQLERANAFLIPMDEQRQSYRYHALFGEFLLEKLRQSSPELLISLHQRAARYFERQQMREEALEHALAGEDIARAGRLIEQLGDEILWKRGEVKLLLSWMQRLPSSRYEGNPRLAMLYAWALLLSGEREPEGVAALLEAIERREDTALIQKGEIAALRARIAAFHDDIPQVIAFSQQALQELPEERALLRADVAFGLSGTYTARKDLDTAYRLLAEALHISQALFSLRTAMFASRYLAAICVEQGRLSEAEAILRQALYFAGAREGTRVPATGIVHIGMAELLYERNEIAAALQHASLGIALGEASGEIKVILGGYCILALILAIRGEIAQAWQHLWKAERIATIGKVRWLSEQVAMIAIRLSLLQEDTGGAQRALRQIGIDPEASMAQAPPEGQEQVRLMLARVWLAEEKYEEVKELLAPIITAAHAGKRVKVLLAARALQASALYRLRERLAAHVLSEVLGLAGPQGYMRTLLDIGEPLQKLLQGVEVTREARMYARKLREANGAGDLAVEGCEDLSEREHEVLHLMAAGMSNQEIAENLIIEVSTVKVHVRHVCQKLGVQKRLQAVVKAREMGLLKSS
ncbi:hypothetical protein EPA93_12775 [Ktedonosporobacter rubrisoli]|uniref:HTH luxR-type domain-containing protein n=1 Tax=Ktedonosporobacter rubrisoli TaxID=2509675 RepID=A0A4P6JNX7_KTERU|nr:LuxR C-terminal-related transcriptional regulator [Ktedonosporobacter rubrisoli]QBD76830.1 hypothetical protein EPA93_12775 [Ktedonosporobacter rubrisoli]